MVETQGRRRQSVVRTDRAIFDALKDSLTNGGIDSLTAAGVARAAGVSVGAIYSRAESLPELLNMLWIDSVGNEFLEVLDAVVESSRAQDINGFGRVITSFDHRIRAASPAIEMAIASLFDDEMDEVVGSQIRDKFHDLIHARRETAHESASAMLVLSYFCGRALTRCRISRMPRPDEASMTVLQDFWSMPLVPIGTSSGTDITFLRDESIGTSTDIERAVIEVVGSRGFRRATIARIARRAGVTPGAVLSKGESKIDLVKRATDRLLMNPREVWETYVEQSGRLVTGETRAAFVKDLVQPRNARQWRINLELARLAEIHPEFGRFKTPSDVLQQTHQGVMFVASFSRNIDDLPYGGPFQAGSAT